MIVSLLAPLLISIAVAAIATSAHRRLPPQLAARFVTIALVVVVAGAAPTAFVLALAFLAHVPVLGAGFQWCAQVIGIHQYVPAWLGVPALLLVAAGTVRVFRLLRHHRSLRVDQPAPIHVVPGRRPYAVTLPGRAGQIVMSTALIELLDPDEQAVVLAHEKAHARYRHDRYLLAAELAAAALPPLRALTRRVNFSIERWADEAAARQCGDREFVAVTLGKVALHTTPATVAGFAGLGVAARMGALLAPPVPSPRRLQLGVMWASLAVTAAFSVFQLHHVERLVVALCPH